ncbi:MAG TPA: DUF3035 domain-containing protein [Alphaproteobacteria bacterium]
MKNAACGRSHRRAKAGIVGALILSAGLALSGCSEARKAIGWEKTPPDEFRIVSRAPLSLPPDFTLRPPQPGAPRPQDYTAQQLARQALLGDRSRASDAVENGSPSGAEAALLARVGAGASDARIREVVNREAQELAEAERTLLDRIIFWRTPEEPGTVVDAAREAQRIRENQALGRPVTEGETPTIQRRKRGPLEGIF